MPAEDADQLLEAAARWKLYAERIEAAVDWREGTERAQ